MAAKLILIRHGQSEWNLENRFTGWVDVDLTDKGREEAREAGRKIKGIPIDEVFTSLLKRAINTLTIVLEEAGLAGMTYESDQALNERHYGDLQGLNKAETAKEFGEAQVQLWRRSYDVAPPNGESLEDTAERTLPYFNIRIKPLVEQGKNVLVVAHGNSLRSIIMYLDNLSPEEIVKVEIPTGVPLVYDFEGSQITGKGYL